MGYVVWFIGILMCTAFISGVLTETEDNTPAIIGASIFIVAWSIGNILFQIGYATAKEKK